MGLVAVPLTSAQAATPEQEYAAAAFKATNKQRTQRDLAPYKQSSCLQPYATKQAKKMARQRHISHQNLDAVMRACGLSNAGENVAYGFTSGKSVVNDGWMNSAPHRANILSHRFRLMAIAARQSGDGTWYVAQVFGKKR